MSWQYFNLDNSAGILQFAREAVYEQDTPGISCSSSVGATFWGPDEALAGRIRATVLERRATSPWSAEGALEPIRGEPEGPQCA